MRRKRPSLWATGERRAMDTYELSDDAKEVDPHMVAVQNPADYAVMDPSTNQRVPKGGAWGMIVRRLPPMEGKIDEKVRVGRVFWLEHEANADDYGFLPDGRYRVVVNTIWGSLKLWPYEYTVVPPERLLLYWQENALLFRPTNLDMAKFNDVVFYARARGIKLGDAAAMALGTMKGNVGWFEPHPTLVEWLEGLAARMNEWPWDTRKRRAVRKAEKENRCSQNPHKEVC